MTVQVIFHLLISASRKKFAQIAKVFSRRKRTSGRTLLPSGGRDQLLISADPLIEDEDDERQAQVSMEDVSQYIYSSVNMIYFCYCTGWITAKLHLAG